MGPFNFSIDFYEDHCVFQTPRILEATTERRSQFDMPSPMGDVALEGALNCKMAVTDGKRANDRSWKPVWAVLRGHALYLHKDKLNVVSKMVSSHVVLTQEILISCHVSLLIKQLKDIALI